MCIIVDAGKKRAVTTIGDILTFLGLLMCYEKKPAMPLWYPCLSRGLISLLHFIGKEIAYEIAHGTKRRKSLKACG